MSPQLLPKTLQAQATQHRPAFCNAAVSSLFCPFLHDSSVMFNLFLTSGTPIFEWKFIRVTKEGIYLASTMAVRLILHLCSALSSMIAACFHRHCQVSCPAECGDKKRHQKRHHPCMLLAVLPEMNVNAAECAEHSGNNKNAQDYTSSVIRAEPARNGIVVLQS